MTFHNQDEITLGRSEASSLSWLEDDSSIDHGVFLGVSRQHALIRRYDEEGYFIEDLGSTNGTWVNGRRLTKHIPFPLHNGDQVALGELIFFVYFSFSDPEVVHTLLLKVGSQSGMEQSRSTLSVPDLLEKVGSYLSALANVQYVLDEAQEQPFTVDVDHVRRHENGQWVEVTLRGAGQAIDAIRTTVAELPDAYDREANQYPHAYRLAAYRIIKTVAPNLKGEKQLQFTEQLLPHMVHIAQSDFEIVTYRVKRG